MTSFPVSPKAGTAQSLEVLYGLDKESLNATNAQTLLIDLHYHFQRSEAYEASRDDMGTLGFNLCGWHRSKRKETFEKQSMSCLDKCILVEEREYRDAVRSLAEASDDELADAFS